MRVRVAVQMGMHDETVWMRRAQPVMVRDDPFQAQLGAGGDFFHGTHPAIHGDEKVRVPRLFQISNAVQMQPVPIIKAVGDEEGDLRAELLQDPAQERRGRHAVHIVVAVDDDGFAARDGLLDALRRRAHAREGQRVRGP